MQRTENPNRLDISETEADRVAQFKELLELLELERRTYAKAKAADGIQQAFDALLRHLHRFSNYDVLMLYGRTASKLQKPKTPLPSTDELNSMPLEQIEDIVANESTPRRLLEEIAVTRFHFPRGSLRSLANIKQLKDKIDTRIRNERAHKVISSAAQRAR
jgi:hypothetical protein